ncbi:MAG: type II toxin-antitoxin system VapC family toxin [bacterium]|nr:type II toxin-antitoxin system VapC family toxin [bacterium]
MSEIEKLIDTSTISDVIKGTDFAVKASEIYAKLKSRGELIDDMDILIAATALENRLILVTENADHFQRITDIKVESWRAK